MMNAGQSLNQLLIQGLSQLEQVFNDGKQRDAVIIQGDTTTVLAAGLVAFSMKIPVAHVEAGLRSYDLDHPFLKKVIDNWCLELLVGILHPLSNRNKIYFLKIFHQMQ
jgi:UDP-N-acetylglucosamine 2-epimerase